MECSIYSTEELVVCPENKKEIYTLIDVDPVEEKYNYFTGLYYSRCYYVFNFSISE